MAEQVPSDSNSKPSSTATDVDTSSSDKEINHESTEVQDAKPTYTDSTILQNDTCMKVVATQELDIGSSDKEVNHKSTEVEDANTDSTILQNDTRKK